jgi:putative transposase
MPRPARAFFAGEVHHLVLRGNNGGAIFQDDVDRARFLDILRDAALTHRVAVHAYVLMDNHLHLLATPAQADSLSRMVQTVGRSYVVPFNQRHGRSGTLWEGRFKAHLLEAEAYLLIAMRFIESNPVRAGLAPGLLAIRWSSLAHHLGYRRDPLITEHAVYWALGNTPFEREAAYRRWMEEGASPGEVQALRLAIRSSRPLARAEFAAAMAEASGVPLKPRPRGRPRNSRPSDSGTN